jgi:Domain of unknown function (DUF4926)
MMNNTINLLDVVALAEDLPEHGLPRGQVGTVVEELAADVFLIEFSDDQGRTYAMLPLKTHQLIVLHFELAETQLVGKV